MRDDTYGPGKSWRHRLTNYRRTGRPLADLSAHIYRMRYGHYDASNNPSVRRHKRCSCNNAPAMLTGAERVA